MRALILLAVGTTLAGCAEYEQRQAEQQMAAADGECRSYGFQPGTDGYANCRMNFANRQAATRTAVFESWMANQQAQQRNQPAPYMVPVPRQTNCTSAINGQTVNTTCN